jgi:hypothetical protein
LGYFVKIRAPDRRKVLRAVHPNAGITDWYAAELQQLLQLAVLDAVIMLTGAYPEPIPVGIATDALVRPFYAEPFGELYVMAVDAPPTITKIDRALKKWGDKWSKKFDRLSKNVSKAFAKRSFVATDVAMRVALKDAGFTVSFKPNRRALESYKLVVADNVGLIRNLQQSLYSKIQQDTWASVRAGADMNTLSTKLQRSYGIEAKRAALIARDQNAKAKAVLESTRRQELGITKAIWQHSGGGKEPRPVHLQWGAQGKVFDLNKGLWDPDEQEFVLPGTLINCRCTSRAIIPGLEDEE